MRDLNMSKEGRLYNHQMLKSYAYESEHEK